MTELIPFVEHAVGQMALAFLGIRPRGGPDGRPAPGDAVARGGGQAGRRELGQPLDDHATLARRPTAHVSRADRLFMELQLLSSVVGDAPRSCTNG